jgi:membrane protein involved in D-alanine export
MLAAGPIQAYDEFAAQPEVPAKPKVRDVLEGVERIAKGLFKKLVLAYVLEELFLTGFRTEGWYLVFEAQVFSIWLFLDFSGYSDIAVGMGRLMGVATPENFDRPYFARNMINYWERWHITLGMFIRRNLFIPVQLALMRRTAGRHPLWCAGVAFLVAFGLCGMWHGISLQFVAWGLLHASGMVVSNLWRHALTRRYGTKGFKRYVADWRFRALAVLLTFEFVAFSLVVAFYPLEKLF